MEVKEVLKKVKEKRIRWIDLHFVDLLGKLQHITVPARELNEEMFKKGFGKLDGSSIKGFKTIEESDLVLVPVPDTFAVIPWTEGVGATARFICKIYDMYGKGRFVRDPRYVAERASEYAANLGYKACLGPEVEFFLFDSVEVDVMTPQSGISYSIYSREAPWSMEQPVIRFKEGYYPVPPMDKVWLVRQEAAEVLEDYFGFEVEAHHHEVATAGQGEIDFKFDELVKAADNVITFKYVLKNVAAKHGMIATFMPKPLYGDSGNGMHVHISLHDKDTGKNLFFNSNDGYAELSQLGRYFVGGLLEHARSLTALVAPTVNSYKRLVPGYEAPVYIVWSRANRSACVRVPVYHKNDRNKRIEFRPPDPSCNPYLAFAAILMAGLDGIKKKIDPGDPLDENVYAMDPTRKRELGIKELPGSLIEAIEELESDHEYLKPVFTSELLDTYIELKKEEWRKINMYVSPIEVYEYIDF